MKSIFFVEYEIENNTTMNVKENPSVKNNTRDEVQS